MEIIEKTMDDIVADFIENNIDQKHASFISGLNKDGKPYQIFIFGGHVGHSHYLNELLVKMKDNDSEYFPPLTEEEELQMDREHLENTKQYLKEKYPNLNSEEIDEKIKRIEKRLYKGE